MHSGNRQKVYYLSLKRFSPTNIFTKINAAIVACIECANVCACVCVDVHAFQFLDRNVFELSSFFFVCKRLWNNNDNKNKLCVSVPVYRMQIFLYVSNIPRTHEWNISYIYAHSILYLLNWMLLISFCYWKICTQCMRQRRTTLKILNVSTFAWNYFILRKTVAFVNITTIFEKLSIFENFSILQVFYF